MLGQVGEVAEHQRLALARWQASQRGYRRPLSLAGQHRRFRRRGRWYRQRLGGSLAVAMRRPAAVQDRSPYVAKRMAVVGDAAPGPVEAAEGVLYHILGRLPV